mmetsp:Transcript_61877/g.130645  ORF Transcript_61877/g.130645 Transcript_61877/m.130645 type:complete len:151 (-) Transcript_61877:23-475(-)
MKMMAAMTKSTRRRRRRRRKRRCSFGSGRGCRSSQEKHRTTTIMRTTTTTTTTIAASLAPGQSEEQCADIDENCADGVGNGDKCGDDYMEIYCRKSCNLCGAPKSGSQHTPSSQTSVESCVDSNEMCDEWAKDGCDEAISVFCKRSCGLC